MNPKKYDLLIGTYTHSCKSEGIYVYTLNSETLSIQKKGSTQNLKNPSFACVDDSQKVVYCVNEDGPSSGISAFNYCARDGVFTFINKLNLPGADPCSVINDTKHVIAAAYATGSVMVINKNPDGSLGGIKQIVVHSGSSSDRERQEKAHAHSVCFSPDGRQLLAADLGTDKIYVYQYSADHATEPLSLNYHISITRGSGPRHLCFHPSGEFFAIVNELSATVEIYSYNEKQSRLLQSVDLAKGRPREYRSGGDIIFSNDGRYLYVTNREKADTVTVFEVTPEGTLETIQQISSCGHGPRSLVISPEGNQLFVANENSNNIVQYNREVQTGLLAETGKSLSICAPVYLQFIDTGLSSGF